MNNIRFRAAQKAMAISQAGFAKRMGVSTSSVEKWAQGLVKPSPTHIVEIARHLNVTVDYLMGEGEAVEFGITNKDRKHLATLVKLSGQ
jgi:transcriptional regulator with XRE-family HTH domain